MSDIHLVRQPVFDATESAVGYELRYRDVGGGGDALVRSCLSGAVDVLRDGLPAWVYPNWRELTDESFGFADPASLWVMLPTDIANDPAHVEKVASLAKRGVTVVIDEFERPSGAEAPQLAFLSHARVVRFDLRVHQLDDIAPLVASLKKIGKRLAADQVLDRKMYNACRAAGFEFFQGPHFAKPEPLPTSELPSSAITALRVMALARDPDVSERDIERAISADPAIVLQLLRIVNSAAIGGRGVTSIAHALRLAGREKLSKWLSLAAYAARAGSSGIADELTRQAVQRAFFAEALVSKAGQQNPGTAFLVGLFSLLDSVFRMPLTDVLARVNLADDVREALLDRTGHYADALAVIEAYELGLWESAAENSKAVGVDSALLPEMYAASVTAAEEVVPRKAA